MSEQIRVRSNQEQYRSLETVIKDHQGVWASERQAEFIRNRFGRGLYSAGLALAADQYIVTADAACDTTQTGEPERRAYEIIYLCDNSGVLAKYRRQINTWADRTPHLRWSRP